MRSPLRLTLPLITQPAGVARPRTLPGDRWPALAKRLPGAGSGFGIRPNAVEPRAKVRAASGFRRMTMSLSCCLSPEADRLAEPERRMLPSIEYDLRCIYGPGAFTRTLARDLAQVFKGVLLAGVENDALMRAHRRGVAIGASMTAQSVSE